MALSKIKTVNGSGTYRPKGRYKVGAVVSLDGVTYQNVTGRNSAPIDGVDWVKVSSSQSTAQSYYQLFNYAGSNDFTVPLNLVITSVEVNSVTTIDYLKLGTNLNYSGFLEVGDSLLVQGIIVSDLYISGGGDFIPLSGTEVGKPVTGDIEFFGERLLIARHPDGGCAKIVLSSDRAISLTSQNTDGTIFRGISTDTETDRISILGKGGNFKGLVGERLFDKQSDPNAFAQLGDIPIVQENPTENSTDAVSSGGVFGALAFKENTANKNQNNGYCGLDSGGKVPIANLPTTLLKYQGVWNASTNTPTLTNPDLTKVGNVYNVSVAGTQFGITWNLGDWLIYNASGVPEKSDNSDDVVSVNGQTGVVTLTTANVNDTTGRRYVTEAEKATWNAKENAITAGTTAQYFRGDKTFQNVADLPISTAQATAFNARQLKSRTIYQGYTTVTGVVVPTIAFSVQIPANTYESIDAFEVIVTINKSSTVTAVNYNLFHDTVVNGTANAIATGISVASAIRASAFQRQLNLSGGSAFNSLPSGTSVLDAFNSSGSISTTTTFNPAVNNFITLQISGHTVVSETSSVTLSIRPLKG